MPITSSPIVFPPSSSPPAATTKRPRPQDVPKAPKLRVLGGFVDDDDDDEDDNEGTSQDADLAEPLPKRRQLEHSKEDAVETAAPDSAGIRTPPESQQTENEVSQEEAERYERLFGPSQSVSTATVTATATILTATTTATTTTTSSTEYRVSTCSGRSMSIRERKPVTSASYQTIVAARSRTKEGRATRSYYGIPIHELVDAANKQIAEQQKEQEQEQQQTPAPTHHLPDKPIHSVEDRAPPNSKKPKRTMLWTEKYRARTFMDLVGDDLTNRQVLRWLKRWDPLVFPHTAKSRKKKFSSRPGAGSKLQSQSQAGGQQGGTEEEQPLRKILMLTGPPGLGKTTLAHVCARQAGYEVMEINASDERSGQVVKGRIRTSLATESVKTVEHGRKKQPQQQQQKQQQPQRLLVDTTAPGGLQSSNKPQKVARPVCVVVDEVDGVVGGSGASGEGGFVKALMDLVLLDQSNTNQPSYSSTGDSSYRRNRRNKGDDFRQMRPLILICNDVYHPSLRPLRQSGLAEIIHVGKPPLEAVVTRLKTVFEKEGIPCEKDAARKLCEAAWGVTSGAAASANESTVDGDLRGVMVVGEWVAGRLRAASASEGVTPCLTRQWVDRHVLHDLAHGGSGARGLGRGGVREIVSRIFIEGAGFPRQAALSAAATAVPKNIRHEQPQEQLGFAEQQRKYATARLREMVDTSGETERVVAEVFAEFPAREFNDDSFLSKPDAAYEWLHFHDACNARMWGGGNGSGGGSSQDWELLPYTSLPVLACHHLFASPYSRHTAAANNYNNNNATGTTGEEGGGAPAAPAPFSGPRAEYAAREAEKANRAALQGIQAGLPPSLARAFRGPEHVATDFLPYLVRLVSPDVKPIIVGGSSGGGGGRGGGWGERVPVAAVASVRREAEKVMVRRATEVLADVRIALVRGRLETAAAADGREQLLGRAQWVYRMEPDLDALATFETAGPSLLSAPTRYAVRQVLDQELQRTTAMRENAARQARFKAGAGTGVDDDDDDKENSTSSNRAARSSKEKQQDTKPAVAVKRDFFGRVIVEEAPRPRPLGETDGNSGKRNRAGSGASSSVAPAKVWVTFHEGLNNAVTKPISMEEFLRGL